MKISVVVPFYNEEGNIEFVLKEIVETLNGLTVPYEIIAVDDCSRDQTPVLLKQAMAGIPALRVMTHPRNLGQSAALWTGLQAVTGDVVITLDGDRQNDFRDVPRLLPLLDQYDAVFGQRARRNDPPQKLVASRIAFWVRNAILRDGVRDSACAFRLMKAHTLKYILPMNGLQRFIPSMFYEAGISFIAVDVNHRNRSAGESKFSLLRLYFVPVIGDLFFMAWYRKRNLYRLIRRASESKTS